MALTKQPATPPDRADRETHREVIASWANRPSFPLAKPPSHPVYPFVAEEQGQRMMDNHIQLNSVMRKWLKSGQGRPLFFRAQTGLQYNVHLIKHIPNS